MRSLITRRERALWWASDLAWLPMSVRCWFERRAEVLHDRRLVWDEAIGDYVQR